MDNNLLIIGCTFGAVALVGLFVANFMFDRGEGDKLRDRLTGGGKPTEPLAGNAAPKTGGVKAVLDKIGQAAAQPFMPKTREKQSSLRKTLGFAGIYAPGALKLVTGSKVIFMFVGLVLGYIAGMK